jgi:hypothetical protein
MPMHELDRLEAEAGAGADLDGLLIAVDEALPGLPAVQRGAAEQESVLQGRAVPAHGPGASKVRMYGADGRFLGVGRMSAEGARLAPERIMVRLPQRADPRA